jgi:hypothetical protein
MEAAQLLPVFITKVDDLAPPTYYLLPTTSTVNLQIALDQLRSKATTFLSTSPPTKSNKLGVK